MKKIPYSFECQPYGDFTSVTPLISKGRLRVYYKGLNRNGGYITDEFSSKLEQSLPYTPVVGEYDAVTQEFKSHNMDRNVAAIYGIVPEDPKISWEPHLDKDGTTRVYLCCDVYLYTGRYDAAKNIIGKPHSMELNRDSLKGNWERRGLDEVFVYQDAYFDGLCVLGENVEPCFEGSGFFSHETGAIKILEDYVRNRTNKLEDVGLGGKRMEEKKVLDSELEVEVENEAEVETSSDFEELKIPTTEPIEDEGTEKEPDEEPEVVVAPDEDPIEHPTNTPAPSNEESNEEGSEEPVEDAPVESGSEDNGEGDGTEGGNASEAALRDEDEDEDKDCDPDKEKDDDKFELSLDVSFEEIKNLFPSVAEEFDNLNDKILEYTTEIATLQTKVQELESSLEVYVAKEQEELDIQRESLLDEYSKYLEEDVLDEIRSKASDYTVENLEKELLFTAKKANPNFLKVQDGATFASLRTQGKEGIYRILENYKQKQNR